eukprot:GEZU01042483.1.p1 GENE.GEZU01042483.1~~GEZU01042483.1.p1  ORF type:complete len:298 (+),score=52.72 GEZU01042483.1:100-993(+)
MAQIISENQQSGKVLSVYKKQCRCGFGRPDDDYDDIDEGTSSDYNCVCKTTTITTSSTTFDSDGAPQTTTTVVSKTVFDTSFYSKHEEIANSITAGIGAALSVIGLSVLIYKSIFHGQNMLQVTSVLVFGMALVMLHWSSTLYHSLSNWPRARRFFHHMDHISIYVMIAGSYTPMCLWTLRETIVGYAVCALVWLIAITGIIIIFLRPSLHTTISLIIYLLMGWVGFVAAKPLIQLAPMGGLVLLVAGGLSYLLGVFFFVKESIKYSHAVWHVFYIFGSGFHYFAVLFYVIPVQMLQ